MHLFLLFPDKIVIKYSLSSAAIMAYEHLNEKCIGLSNFPIKIHMMNSKYEDEEETNQNLESNYEKTKKLFIKIGKTTTKNDLYETFSVSSLFCSIFKKKILNLKITKIQRYGFVRNVFIINHNVTKENLGLAYVTFSKGSEAARAFEQCSSSRLISFNYIFFSFLYLYVCMYVFLQIKASNQNLHLSLAPTPNLPNSFRID